MENCLCYDLIKIANCKNDYSFQMPQETLMRFRANTTSSSGDPEHFFIINIQSSTRKTHRCFTGPSGYQKMERNRQFLALIISTIIFTARLGILFRGHRNDWVLLIPDSTGSINASSGNFKALLQFRAASVDQVLVQHLDKCRRNARYINYQPQNQLLNIIRSIIIDRIVSRVIASKYFTVIADETLASQERSRSQSLSGTGYCDVTEVRE